MIKKTSNQMKELEQNFRKLIIERCRFCGFDYFFKGG